MDNKKMSSGFKSINVNSTRLGDIGTFWIQKLDEVEKSNLKIAEKS